MAESHRRKVKSDDDSEGSFSESEDGNEVEISTEQTPEKSSKRRRRRVVSNGSDEHSVSESESETEAESKLKLKIEGDAPKATGESEYESAEEEDEKELHLTTELDQNDPECGSEELELPPDIDEEGGKEGIAETEEVGGDFLNGDGLDEASEDEDYVEEERQQGDGEECSPEDTALEKELDFDEDRRNPQYIPKKGIFYEHDDRINEDVKEKEEEPPRDKKKKLWLDEGKWGHDRFREEEQIPKSRGELIEIYGYDIRCEDGPPRARRRRRYGRGPTKYERNWEDVTAYAREKFRGASRGASRGRRSRGRFRGATRYRGRGRDGYESERLDSKEDGHTSGDEANENLQDDKEIISNDEEAIINNKDFPSLPQWNNDNKEKEPEVEKLPEKPTFSETISSSDPIAEEPSVRTLTFENSSLTNKHVPEYEVPPRRIKNPPFRGNYRSTGRKPIARSHRGSGRGDYPRRGRITRHISPRFMENRNNNNITSGMAQLSVDDAEDDVEVPMHNQAEVLLNSANLNELSNSSQPSKTTSDSSGRPKRYSSLRQRSLPETNSYPASQVTVSSPQATYYETGYRPPIYAAAELPSSQSQTVASQPIMNPSAYQTFATTPYTDSYGLRIPVASAPRLFSQAPVAAGQPILAPPPCITPSPNIMNFAPPPAPSGYHQFTFQQYASPPPVPPPPVAIDAPPNELYRSGITYYYPQNQPPPVRPTVQKRPKAAIPILPPPESEGKRKKDVSQPESDSCNNNFVENTNDSSDAGISSLRTEPSTVPLQSSVGVES